MKTVLIIAGSDSCGGAGVQLDLAVCRALGLYPATALTAVTAQNTRTITQIHPLPAQMLSAQIEAILEDITPDAVKIGMVWDEDQAKAIGACIVRHRLKNIVTDPIDVSSGGTVLHDASRSAWETLLPLSDLITPNLPEAQKLCGCPITSREEREAAARELYERYASPVLLKGGHADGDDVYYDGRAITWFCGERINVSDVHGTGCALSSAIACYLAQNVPMDESIRRAKQYLTKAIKNSFPLGIGRRVLGI